MTIPEKELELQKMREENKKLANSVAFEKGITIGVLGVMVLVILLKLLLR